MPITLNSAIALDDDARLSRRPVYTVKVHVASREIELVHKPTYAYEIRIQFAHRQYASVLMTGTIWRAQDGEFAFFQQYGIDQRNVELAYA